MKVATSPPLQRPIPIPEGAHMSRSVVRGWLLWIPLMLAVGGCQDPIAPLRAPPAPQQAARLPAFGFALSSISAGSTGSCGVTAGGQAYCWGGNPQGVLGNGTLDPSNVPVPVSGGLTFTSVDQGALASCGLAKRGEAYCWGNGAFGALGDGTRGTTTVPVAVVGGITFSMLSSSRMGLGFACGVAKGGQAYCWGIDGEGELGNGSSTPGVDFDTPVPVQGGITFSSTSAGAFHACGLARGGALYCWGNNSNGELGLGFTGSTFGSGSSVPARVATGQVFVQVSAGGAHSCGVTKNRTGYCWGANHHGQLGDGTTAVRNAPVPIAGGLPLVSVSAGSTSTCGLTAKGQVFCWGSNTMGQLGIGSIGEDPTPFPVPVAGGFTFTSVSTGAGFACGLTSKLGAFCWGDNSQGQLGIGSSIPYTDAPSPVATP